MAHGRQIVDFVRLKFLVQSNKIGGIGQITMMKEKANSYFMGIILEVINPCRIERGSSPLDPVDHIAFSKQKFGKVGAVLTCDTCDEGDFLHLG